MGEAKRKALARQNGAMALDTFGGRIHVEWDPTAAVTPLGQLPFFIEFLKVSGLFDAWVVDCPLEYQSNDASDKRAVLATFLLSILAGHHRYAHITGIRNDGIQPELLGVAQLVSEDAARRALKRMDESLGVAWLDRHLAKTTQPLLATPWILDLDATVKCLYGKQEGAVVGYNPKKPGRPSAENNFDELKNQWGWGGFTTQDLARCRLMARIVALVYNWWNLFVRLAQPHKHYEAITSRPLLLHGVATQTRHAGQTHLTITSTHAKQAAIQTVLTSLAGFLSSLKATAEQLTDTQRLQAILTRAFVKFMLTTSNPPALLNAQWIRFDSSTAFSKII